MRFIEKIKEKPLLLCSIIVSSMIVDQVCEICNVSGVKNFVMGLLVTLPLWMIFWHDKEDIDL